MTSLSSILVAVLTIVFFRSSFLSFFQSIFRWFQPAKQVPGAKSLLVKEINTATAETRKSTAKKESSDKQLVCVDPSTLQELCVVDVMSGDVVRETISKARKQQQQWQQQPFHVRRNLLNVLLRCVVENAEEIAKICAIDSGKTVVDAMFGEILVTCEKLRWTINSGESWLVPEYRTSGLLNLHKTSRVEYIPVGVVGGIVPFNYPFHNMVNPFISCLFAGNALVLKPSEHTSWSALVFEKLLHRCMEQCGVSSDLFRVVVGAGDTGRALLTGGVDKVIFVGSVEVGKKVMATCSQSLTPVILELGGKDPFVVCDDADVKPILMLACRGVFQNMGQNCAGPERFIVHTKVYDEFCQGAREIVELMKMGPPLSRDGVDCGAMRMPTAPSGCQELINDAVSRGARVLVGGKIPSCEGQFYPPTVICDVTTDMRIAKEEIFGPIMCIFRCENDENAIEIANSSDFALSACAHSRDQARAAEICRRIHSGMASVNDLEGTTYLSQSLPFGGNKMSGFGRFAGPEGLRGLCNEKSICENRFSFLAPSIPKPIAYPMRNNTGDTFCKGLVGVMYGYSIWDRLLGVRDLIAASL